MTEFCPVCGISYARFRAPGQLTFQQAQSAQWQTSKADAARGDYSTPATKSRILGLMHQVKQEGWDEHVRLCGEYAALEALYLVDLDALEERGEWDAVDDIRRSIRELENDLGVSDEVPF